MALFKSKGENSKNNYKEIKNIINKNIGSALKTQGQFSELLRLNGCPMRKVGSIGAKIRKQLLEEAKNGDLTEETVMPRAYELIGEFLEISYVKKFEDNVVENNVPHIENNKPLYCGNCGNLIADNSKFCSNCGTKLINNTIICSKCGKINESNSNFCEKCGNDLKNNKPYTREEFEEKVEKIRDNIKSSDFGVVSIAGKTIGNNKIEKDNPNINSGDVKFKSIDLGFDIGKNLNEKLDDIIIEEYGTPDEKVEMELRHSQKRIKTEKKHILYEKYHEANDLYFNHDYENAIVLYREIIDNGEIYDESVLLSYSSLKDCYEMIHDYDSAISVINEHIKVKKEFDLDYDDLEKEIENIKKSEISYKCKGLSQKAVYNFYKGKYDEAKSLFNECVDLGHDNAQTYNLLASIHIRNKDFESAKEVLEKGVENVTWEYSIHNEHNTGLGDRLSNINNYLETGNLIGEPLPYDSESMKSEIKNAKRILKEEDKEKGVKLLENIIKEGTYSNTVYYTLYQTYMKDEKYDSAIRISELAITNLGLFDEDRLNKWDMYKNKAITKKEKEMLK